MSAIHAISVQLTEINCGVCGGVYAVNAMFHKHKQDKGGYWTCPYCKCDWGFDKSETELARTQRELEEERKRRNDALARANEAAAARDKAERALKRHKTRAKNGVCPCCKRTFKQLARHMKSKHPEFAAE